MNKSLVRVFSLMTMLALILGGLPVQNVQALSADIVISQVYGGGGNSGAPYTHDFVELFNRGNTTVSLAGLSIQYTSATGTGNFGSSSTLLTELPNVSLAPGQYFLVQQAGGINGVALPTPDLVDPTPIAMAAGAGKVALVNSTTTLGCNGGSTPCSPAQLAQIIDLVGYGNANFFEGSGAAPTLTNTTSAVRALNGCQETDDNAADFSATTTITPRNTSSPTQSCGSSEPTAPVINEFSASTAGTDVEYVEFYGDPNTDYSAYTLLEIEGDAGAAVGTVDEVINLGTTDANGLYLVNLPANALENGTITLLLVKNFVGALNTDLDADNDGVFDTTPWDAIVDSVAVNDGGAGDITYGTPTLGVAYDGLPFAPGGASRIPDGTDTDTAADWVRNDFDLAGIPGFDGTPEVGEAYNTPGALNAVIPPPAPQLVINEIDYDQPSSDTAEFIEIKNKGSFAVSLDGWTLELVNGNGGGAVIYNTIALPAVSLAAGEYFVVCANAATVANCDLDASPNTDFIQNGAPDAVGLRFNGELMDAVSYEGDTGAPYTEGAGVGLVDSGANANEGISRCPDGADTNVNNVDFTLVGITPGAANSCASAAPQLSVNDVSQNEGNSGTTTFTFTVSLSVPALAGGVTFDIATADNTATVANNDYIANSLTGQTIPSGSSTYTFSVLVNGDTTDEPDETFFINVTNVTGATVVDGQGLGTILNDDSNACVLTYTPIYDIQGSGMTAAITGTVTTQGIVVGDYEGPSPTLRGFYIQDMTGDGNVATSDGIFVFNGNNNNVSLGDVVRVTGTAAEFQDQTQISASSVINCGTGTVTPVDITFPVPSADYLERYEGMLVRIPQTMYVTEHFQLGRFGQVLLSGNGRLQQPTNIVLPGAPALAMQAANDLNKIILDDDLQSQNPDPILFGRGGLPLSASNTLRGGDTITGVVGIMTYTWSGNAASGNAYRLRPINALGGGSPNFVPANLRPTEAPDVGGSLQVVGFNLLNYFNTFTNCTNGLGGTPSNSNCRGAENLDEFNRQWVKTVVAILAMDPDVIGVNEIENDGYGPDSAIADLVDRLNTATAPGTYAFIDADAATGQVNALGTDGIKVGLIYKPGSVTPVGQTAVLNSVAFVNGGDSAPRNRASLAQAFQQNSNGAVFIVNANHLKSKGSACDLPDQGDGQGNCNQVRLNAVDELMSWFATDPTGTGDPDILLIGDYNSYAMEDPIIALQNGGFTHLIKTFLGPDAYSYVFDGQWGYLDHALATASLASQVSGVADYHINADEPAVLDYNTNFKSPGQIISLYAPDKFRVSDHDPVIVGLNLNNPNNPPTVDAGGPYYVVEGQTVLVSATGSDPDAGDSLTYAWDLDNNGSFETPGQSATFDASTLTAPATYTIKVQVTDNGGLTAEDTATVHVIYNFMGFFQPVENLPVVNGVKAGQAIPIKFSLGGNKGLNIFAAGYPRIEFFSCTSGVVENLEETATAGGSSLSYNTSTDQYTYVWKTDKAWAGKCGTLLVTFNDGTTYTALFKFTK